LNKPTPTTVRGASVRARVSESLRYSRRSSACCSLGRRLRRFRWGTRLRLFAGISETAPQHANRGVSIRTAISSGWSELQSGGWRESYPKDLSVFANAAQFKSAERFEPSVTTSRGLCKPRREQDLSIEPLAEVFDSNHFVNRGSNHREVKPVSRAGCDPKWCNQAVRRSDLFGLLSLAAAARFRVRAFQ
jgi:hypothetical protein